MVGAVRVPRLPSGFQDCNAGLGLEIHIWTEGDLKRPLDALLAPGFSLCVPLRAGVSQEGPETLYSPNSLPLSSAPSAPLPSVPPLGLLPGLSMMRESSEPSSQEEEPETSQQLLKDS